MAKRYKIKVRRIWNGTARIMPTRYPKAHDGGEYRIDSVGKAGRADFQRLSKARDKRARRQVRNLRVAGLWR